MDDCLFCRIANRRLSAHVLFQDELLIAFLDVFPIRPGHTLIIPKIHCDYFETVPAATAARIMEVGQKIARAMKEIYAVPQVAFVYTGSDIPHAHAHLLPMHDKTDITSRHYIEEKDLTFRPAPRAEEGSLAETLARLRAALLSN